MSMSKRCTSERISIRLNQVRRAKSRSFGGVANTIKVVSSLPGLSVAVHLIFKNSLSTSPVAYQTTQRRWRRSLDQTEGRNKGLVGCTIEICPVGQSLFPDAPQKQPLHCVGYGRTAPGARFIPVYGHSARLSIVSGANAGGGTSFGQVTTVVHLCLDECFVINNIR